MKRGRYRSLPSWLLSVRALSNYFPPPLRSPVDRARVQTLHQGGPTVGTFIPGMPRWSFRLSVGARSEPEPDVVLAAPAACLALVYRVRSGLARLAVPAITNGVVSGSRR